ncbi:MAG: ester cyclase [Candidatus Kariarchaeaceae archaeon]|jgi:steroid delta-isomerase-like uncharacterized protein
MSLEHNKTLARLFLTELYGNWRYEIIDDIIHDDYFISRNSVRIIQHENSMPHGVGKKNLRKRVEYFRRALPNTRYELTRIVAEGNEVIVWWIWTATQKEELFGFQTNNGTMRIFGSNLFTIKDGKILNTLVTFDSFSMLVQLGHINIEADDPVFIAQYLENIAKITQDIA